MSEQKTIATAIRHRQHNNGCALYFRSTGAFQTFAGAPCTPNCVCAKEVATSMLQESVTADAILGAAIAQQPASNVIKVAFGKRKPVFVTPIEPECA